MPTLVSDIFADSHITDFKRVDWATRLNDCHEGVYIVSTSSDENKNLGIIDRPVIDEMRI